MTDRTYAGVRGGALYFATPGATTISTQALANAVKAAGTTAIIGTLDTDSRDVTVAVTNRLTANWRGKRLAEVSATVSLSSATAGDEEVGLQIRKNGAAITGLNVSGEVSQADDVTLSLSGILEIDENDYVELWVYNVDSTGNITVQGGTLTIVS